MTEADIEILTTLVVLGIIFGVCLKLDKINKLVKEGKKMVGEYMSLETVKKLNREKTLDTDSKLLNANINLSNINQDLKTEIAILKNDINRAVQMLKDNESKEDIIKLLSVNLK